MTALRTYTIKDIQEAWAIKGYIYVKVNYDINKATKLFPYFINKCLDSQEYDLTIEQSETLIKMFNLELIYEYNLKEQ
jgi:hypothetical protein